MVHGNVSQSQDSFTSSLDCVNVNNVTWLFTSGFNYGINAWTSYLTFSSPFIVARKPPNNRNVLCYFYYDKVSSFRQFKDEIQTISVLRSEITIFTSVQAACESMIFNCLISAARMHIKKWNQNNLVQTNVWWNRSIRVSRTSISLRFIADFRDKNDCNFPWCSTGIYSCSNIVLFIPACIGLHLFKTWRIFSLIHWWHPIVPALYT